MKVHLHNRVGSLGGLQSDIENMFSHMFGSTKSDEACGENCFKPIGDAIETATGFEMVLELPGVALSDINIEFAEDLLRVSGEKKIEMVEEGNSVLRRERVSGKFERTFEFPTQIDPEKIEAKFEDGLLTISAAKSEKVMPRKIAIKSK